MNETLIIDACRTPRGIGKAGRGALTGIHPQRIASTVLAAIAQRNKLDTSEIDDVVWGTSAQGGAQGGDLGRMAALDAGYDICSSGVTLDRFCGSGLTAVSLAAATVGAGMEELVIAGGSEKMSDPGRFAGRLPTMDQGNLHLRSLHPQTNQGLCADAIATLEGIDRETLDQLALSSQQRADNAIRKGYFTRSLVPVYCDSGSLALERDEHPRADTTLEGLSQLKPSFASLDSPLFEGDTVSYRSLMYDKYPDLEINPVHHAGNSSGVVDGAAALALASGNYARAHGLKARARIRAFVNMGDCPTLMLNAPVPATRKVLQKAGLSAEDIDLYEVNEAFAVVPEKFSRDMNISHEKINVNGGAIALGHPIGATGAMLVGTLLDELERRDQQFGLVTMCAGGGMAPALIIERV